MGPSEPRRPGIETEQRQKRQHDQLPASIQLGQNRGREGAAGLDWPEPSRARQSVFPVAAHLAISCSLNEECFPVEKWRSRESEVGDSRLVSCGKIGAPPFFAVGGIDGDQHLAHVANEQSLAVECRRGAYPFSVRGREEWDVAFRGPGMSPEHLAGGSVQGSRRCGLGVHGFDGEDMLAGHGRPRVYLCRGIDTSQARVSPSRWVGQDSPCT